jgi:hypothetical protein
MDKYELSDQGQTWDRAVVNSDCNSDWQKLPIAIAGTLIPRLQNEHLLKTTLPNNKLLFF